jgi:O-antigen ligase
MPAPDWKKWLSLKSVALLPVLAALVIALGYASYRFAPFWVLAPLAGLALAVVIFRNPLHGLYLLAFFLPFERLGSYDISGVTVRPSQVTALLTLAAYLLAMLAKRSFPVPKLPHLAPLAIFAVIGTAGLLNAPNLPRSLLVFGFTLFTISISLLVPLVLRSKTQLTTLLKFLFGAMVIVTIFGLYQFAGDLVGLPPELTGLRDLYTKDVLGFPRVQSTALEPLYYANYLLVPLAILLSFFMSRDRTIPPLFVTGLLGLGLVNLVLTVARGGYIAFAVTAAIILIYYFAQLKLFTWRNFFYLLSGVLVSLVIVSQLVDIQEVSENFVGHVSDLFGGASYSERVEMYEVAYSAWLEHPWVGIGSGSFGPYQSWHPMVVPEQGWKIVNNEYLELLAENGILGLLAISVTFLIVLVRSVKALTVTRDPLLRTVLVGVLAGFAGILVQYNTFSILYIVHIWFMVGWLVALQNLAFTSVRRP